MIFTIDTILLQSRELQEDVSMSLTHQLSKCLRGHSKQYTALVSFPHHTIRPSFSTLALYH